MVSGNKWISNTEKCYGKSMQVRWKLFKNRNFYVLIVEPFEGSHQFPAAHLMAAVMWQGIVTDTIRAEKLTRTIRDVLIDTNNKCHPRK